jgi:hypothetical protein
LTQAGGKKFRKIAPDFDSASRQFRRFISGYVPVEVTQEAGQKRRKMWNEVFPLTLVV